MSAPPPYSPYGQQGQPQYEGGPYTTQPGYQPYPNQQYAPNAPGYAPQQGYGQPYPQQPYGQPYPQQGYPQQPVVVVQETRPQRGSDNTGCWLCVALAAICCCCCGPDCDIDC